jgi:hypothetical protein
LPIPKHIETCRSHRLLSLEFDSRMRDFFENPPLGDVRARTLRDLANAANESVLAESDPADLAFCLTEAAAGVVGCRGLLTVWTCAAGEIFEGCDLQDGRCSDDACRQQGTMLAGCLIGPRQPADSVGATVLATLQRMNPWAWAGVLLCLSDFVTPRYRQRLAASVSNGGDGLPPEVS